MTPKQQRFDDELERAASLDLDTRKIGGNTAQLLSALYRKCRELEARIESLEQPVQSFFPKWHGLGKHDDP